jgi:hypothetical protein
MTTQSWRPPDADPYQEVAGCIDAILRLLTVTDELRIDGRRITDEPSTSYAFAFMQMKQILHDLSAKFWDPKTNERPSDGPSLPDDIQRTAEIFRWEKDQLNATIDQIKQASSISMEKSQHWARKAFNGADIILDSLDFVPGVKGVKEGKKQLENMLPIPQ